MSKLTKYLGLTALLIFAVLITACNDEMETPSVDDDQLTSAEVEVKEAYPEKIVYQQNPELDLADYQQDCEERGGVFNECGSVCPEAAEICIEVCGYTCEFTQDDEPDLPPEPITYNGTNNTDLPLEIQTGFAISDFTTEVPGARDLVGPDSLGNYWLSRTEYGAITLITMENGEISNISDVFRDLDNPHGLVFDPEEQFTLYYATEGAVYRTETYTDAAPEKLVDLPTGGRHFTRSLLFGPEDKLYVSIGSEFDADIEDEDRAVVYRMNKDGSEFESFATGLRNAVFMTRHPVSGKIWVTEMGRDNLGDNLPPDEINILEEGADYGYPYCYGQNIPDQSFLEDRDIQNPCAGKTPAHIDLQAHVAPLGLDFIPEEGWSEEYWYDLVVGLHGSWNRTEPVGYKVIRLNLDANGQLESPEPIDLVRGWLRPDEEKLGRPVDVLVQPGGEIYVTDDQRGAIYLITSEEENGDLEGQDLDPIEITNLEELSLNEDPLEITGRAPGTWFFEGTFAIRLLDQNGNQVASSQATALGDWMTEEMVQFEARLDLENSNLNTAELVLERANPSGLPENAAERRLELND
jgi:glucose/arabinose dehydrogenase